jgi:hypothetical protein
MLEEKQHRIPQSAGRDLLELGSQLSDRRSGRAVPLTPLLKSAERRALGIKSGRDFELLRCG